MALSLRLDVRQSQNLVLTPQMQQAIKLLQLSNLELAATLQREIADNPFLSASEPAARARAPAAERTAPLAGTPPEHERDRAATATDQRLGLRRTSAANTGDEGDWRLERLTVRPGLRDHLRDQIGARKLDGTTRALATALVDWIEDDGYLRESDVELAASLGVGEAAVTAARAVLQQCEPTGVGACDLAECLRLQLAERDRLDPAMARLLQRLPVLARADWSRLERWCGVDRADLEEMAAEIKALDPRPGLAFESDEAEAIVPDLVVGATAPGRWSIGLNPAALPRLVVDGDYHTELGATDLDDEARAFVAERFQSANWLTRALEQRARTILRVARATFEHQRGFLERGPDGLRPLVLRDIAAVTGLHESTVSRATHEKYVQTPHGTHPMRYFFTAAIHATEGGDDHSAEAIRRTIRRLIRHEPADAVLSDDAIVTALREQGVDIARRTVAKYRESLNIPSSVQRRRQRALAG